MNTHPTIHTLKIPISQLPKLSNDQKFILVMRLARFYNQLSFCHTAFIQTPANDEPISLRQRFNSSMFASSVLYEAIKIVSDLGKEFKTYPSFKKGFGTFLRDKEVIYLREKVLNKVRNGIVYHIDKGPIEETLETLDIRQLELFTITENEDVGLYFNLADDIALNYLIGKHSSPEKEREYFVEVIDKISSVTQKFIKYTVELIREYIQRKYWKLQTK